MYGRWSRLIAAKIEQLGREAEIHIRKESGQNEFGNVTDKRVLDRTIQAFRTYPNRNTQVQSVKGTRNRDNPVFLMVNTDNPPAPPESGDYLVYDGTTYKMLSPTPYETHIEIFGDPVIHDDTNQ